MTMPIIGDLLPIANRGDRGTRGGDNRRGGWDKKDCSKSKSWSKSRGHKSHGKGRKH